MDEATEREMGVFKPDGWRPAGRNPRPLRSGARDKGDAAERSAIAHSKRVALVLMASSAILVLALIGTMWLFVGGVF